MHDYADRRIQEIVARTVIARGSRPFSQRCVLQPAEKPEQLLGVTCVPGATRAARHDGTVSVTGNFEIHLWYAHSGSQQTTVLKQTFTYENIVPVTPLAGEPVGEPQVTVALTQNPQVASCQIGTDGRFHVDVTLEVQAELTGDARLRVQVFLPPGEAVYDEVGGEDSAFASTEFEVEFEPEYEADFDDDVDEDFDPAFDPTLLPNGHASDVAGSVSAELD